MTHISHSSTPNAYTSTALDSCPSRSSSGGMCVTWQHAIISEFRPARSHLLCPLAAVMQRAFAGPAIPWEIASLDIHQIQADNRQSGEEAHRANGVGRHRRFGGSGAAEPKVGHLHAAAAAVTAGIILFFYALST